MPHVLAATRSTWLRLTSACWLLRYWALTFIKTTRYARLAGAPHGRLMNRSLAQPANDVLVHLLEVSIQHVFMVSRMLFCWAIRICRHSMLENGSPCG